MLTDTDAVLRSLVSEFEAVSVDPERVRECCTQLRRLLSSPPTDNDLDVLRQLAALLGKRQDEPAVVLFDLLEENLASLAQPWVLIEEMLASRDRRLAIRALNLTLRAAAGGTLEVTRAVVARLAALTEREQSHFREPDELHIIRRILDSRVAPQGTAPKDMLRDQFLRDENRVARRLAARLLELDEEPVPDTVRDDLLGPQASRFLAGYLTYTQATWSDLLALDLRPAARSSLVRSLRHAESICGSALLREVIADLGWHRVNLGIEVDRILGLSVNGSMPFMVTPSEAALFSECPGVDAVSDSYLLVAHGESATSDPANAVQGDQVARFRAYNMIHAEVLADILNETPLTPADARRILRLMDRIVEDFVALFASHCEECAILPEVYGDLRGRITGGLESTGASGHVPSEASHLLRTFEDPQTLGEVRTIHGLKRYLHQKGLGLGFRIGSGKSTDRTVTLLLANGTERVTVDRIHYADFDPDRARPRGDTAPPYAVALVVDAFGRQLLHGQRTFPRTDVYCYGNEVHYYLTFVNHPALLRVDFSPPLHGGMIDLKYFGVSKYDLTAHPNPSLDAIRLFLNRLEFNAQVESTRIQARYDKERALDLDDICAKTQAILRLVPYLMDLDWVIGSLSLTREARLEVAEAWAELFRHWGALPIQRLISRDRQGIVAATESGPAGSREVLWSGDFPYRDRFTRLRADDVLPHLAAILVQLGLDAALRAEQGQERQFGQMDIERQVLRPLRRAVARGQLVLTKRGYSVRHERWYLPLHEAVCFAELLAEGGDAVVRAAQLASLVMPLERTIRFLTTGSVNGHAVQTAQLPLPGDDVQIYVLRDKNGVIRLALYGRDGALYRSGKGNGRFSGRSASLELARLLRRSNYVTERPGGALRDEPNPEEILAHFTVACTFRADQRSLGGRVIDGRGASPGRAFGRGLLQIGNRLPEDFKDAILVSPAVRPEDSAYLYRANGIISTGGGILSHAGLLAAQFRKPALIISGTWVEQPDGRAELLYENLQYTEQRSMVRGFTVTAREDLRRCVYRLRDGDLIAMDADRGTMTVLGQSHDALSLCTSLQRLGEATRALAQTSEDHSILNLRGHRLHARHQIEKLLGRLTDSILARYALIEILLGPDLSTGKDSANERARFITLILDNQAVGDTVRALLPELLHDSRDKCRAAIDDARRWIPTSTSVPEILFLRLNAVQSHDSCKVVVEALEASGAGLSSDEIPDMCPIENLAYQRLAELRPALTGPRDEDIENDPTVRHRLRQAAQLDRLLDADEETAERRRLLERRLAAHDEERRERSRSLRILRPEQAGFELAPVIGWKAANLAEIERLGGAGLVPPWFVVTRTALDEMLDNPAAKSPGTPTSSDGDAPTLRNAIHAVLTDSTSTRAVQSGRIRALWENAVIPPALAADCLAAYRQLEQAETDSEAAPPPLVAVRSSTCEEDTEYAARAGEFDTFLCVRGDDAFLSRLKLAWAGFWTERALHSRETTGAESDTVNGGLIVQLMLNSRVSGVLQTVNVAEGRLREIVINAAPGLGEGVVSGVVAADHITIGKEVDPTVPPEQIRYATADKTEKVVFNERAGIGTQRIASPFHQRLSPALGYAEICTLAGIAMRLESAYGYPVDVEFAFQDSRLWILQVRPVAALLSGLSESIERHPLQHPAECHPTASGKESTA